MSTGPLLAVTLGDPAGIGPEVVARALAAPQVRRQVRPLVVGHAGVLRRAVALTGAAVAVRALPAAAAGDPAGAGVGADPGVLDVLEVGDFDADAVAVGQQSPAAGAASHAWVEAAARLALDGRVDAIVTAPIHKGAWQLAGSTDTGHQEVLRRLSGAPYVATMLLSGALRCMHLSTHLSLAEACAYVTRERVLRAILLTDEHFRAWGFARPRIAVAALNPHAGDGGLIGRTEQEEIAPAVADARARGVEASGPWPADSVLPQAARGAYDVVVVMYHDQGHIAIKVHGMEESISVNLGLPFIRTSVDHGTAFDIAGTGRADPRSMIEALGAAASLATRRGLPRPA